MGDIKIKDGAYWIGNKCITNFTMDIKGDFILKVTNTYNIIRECKINISEIHSKEELNDKLFLAAGNYKFLCDKSFDSFYEYMKYLGSK